MITSIGLIDTGESFRADHPQRVVYLDGILTSEFPGCTQRLLTPITVRASRGHSPFIQIEAAVWDTGAVTSCISEEIARREGLKPIDQGIVKTPAGQQDVLYYFTDVHITEEIVIRGVKVAGIPMEGRDSDFIIGMDIISKGSLTIQNDNGKTKMTFAMK